MIIQERHEKQIFLNISKKSGGKDVGFLFVFVFRFSGIRAYISAASENRNLQRILIQLQKVI